MDQVDPALFYTGLVADLYAPLRSSGAPNPAPYIRFVRRSGEPALELGCGDGDPLLDLRARGLDVEGLDSSPDMLARCRADAAARGLVVTLHESPMETMELRRHYRSIYLAGPSFNLLPDDDTAWRALARIRAHLEPDGSALIPLFVPPPVLPRALGVPRVHEDEDGTTLRFSVVSVERDDAARLQASVLRYERERDGDVERLERSWVLHWYSQEGFRQLVSDAGMLVDELLGEDGAPASPDATSCAFVISRDPTFDRTASVRDRLPPAGRALAAGMLGLDEAIYGERPKVEIVAEADADGLDLGDVDLDVEDPSSSRMTIDPRLRLRSGSGREGSEDPTARCLRRAGDGLYTWKWTSARRHGTARPSPRLLGALRVLFARQLVERVLGGVLDLVDRVGVLAAGLVVDEVTGLVDALLDLLVVLAEPALDRVHQAHADGPPAGMDPACVPATAVSTSGRRAVHVPSASLLVDGSRR